MEKYNLFEEFIMQLASSIKRDERGNIIEAIIPELKFTPKIKVGNRFVTNFNIPHTNSIHEDSKVIDLVQDSAGNLIGIRAEVYTQNSEKLNTIKLASNIKSETQFVRENNIVRDLKNYDDSPRDFLTYNRNGVEPMKI